MIALLEITYTAIFGAYIKKKKTKKTSPIINFHQPFCSLGQKVEGSSSVPALCLQVSPDLTSETIAHRYFDAPTAKL